MTACGEGVSGIQGALDKLKQARLDPLWTNAPNARVRALAPNVVGRVGEELARLVLGGEAMTNNSSGYDLVVKGHRVEVKLATLGLHNGYPMLKWGPIRPADPHTHLCFIAVYQLRLECS